MPIVIYEYESEFGEIFIESESLSSGNKNIPLSGNQDKYNLREKVKVKFEDALSAVKSTASSLNSVIDHVGPNEVTVDFNIKAKGEAGFFAICKATTEADFKISLKWKFEDNTPLKKLK